MAHLVTGMFLTTEDRQSDSPLVDRVWSARSERAGQFCSIAEGNCEVVVTRHRGHAFMTIRGPETKATMAECPADGDWVGIRFTPGTFLPQFPPATVREAKWNNSTILRNVDAIRAVAAGVKGSLLVYGSPRLTQSLMEHDLVDEVRLMLYPLVLGGGRRLFGDMGDKRRFRLRDSKVLGDGIVLVVYERAAS